MNYYHFNPNKLVCRREIVKVEGLVQVSGLVISREKFNFFIKLYKQYNFSKHNQMKYQNLLCCAKI